MDQTCARGAWCTLQAAPAFICPLLMPCLQAKCAALEGVEAEVAALSAQVGALESSAATRDELEAQLAEMATTEAAIARAKAQVGACTAVDISCLVLQPGNWGRCRVVNMPVVP